MVEAIPKHVRCTALSVGYNSTQACFGGTLPLVAVYLIEYTGYPLVPTFYLALAALVSLIALAITSVIPEEEAISAVTTG